MGTCLAVIKVTGITTLGLYTGAVFNSALSNYDILKFVLEKTSTSSTLNSINEFLKYRISINGIALSILGFISSSAFQLAYFGAPIKSKHPYLIYSSLVFPISSIVYYFVARNEVYKFFKLESLIGQAQNPSRKSSKKEQIKSDLDNSVYKDLGETSSLDENEILEDDEIETEVEYHLNQKTGLKALEKLHLADKITAGLSFVGLLIASIGIYGDF